ncbi:hypothetical protein BJX96DRAFT_185888 [Aspergillus floccosus]
MSDSLAAANMLPSAIADSMQNNDHAVLVAVLEDRYYKGVQFHAWRPSDFLLRKIAGQAQHKDSQARLYSLALLAHRSGVSGLLVADWKTLSLIERHKNTFSMAMVMVRQSLEQQGKSGPCHELHVFTCRRPICHVNLKDENPAECRATELLHALYASDVREILASREPLGDDGVYTLELHDPDRPYETSLREMHKALSMHSPLPLELVHGIVSLAHDQQPITPPPSARRSRNRLNIHLLSPATPEELHYTQTVIKQAVRSLLAQGDVHEDDTRTSLLAREDDDELRDDERHEEDVMEDDVGEIQTGDEDNDQHIEDWFYEGPGSEYNFYEDISDDEMFDREICAGNYNAYDDHDDIYPMPRKAKAPKPDEITVELIPWNYSRVATRRDLACIWCAYHRHVTISNTINFLSEPIRDASEFGRARFISIYETPLDFPLVSFTTLENMLNELSSVHHVKRRLQKLTEPLLTDGFSCPDGMEILIEPDRSVYPRSLLWNRFPTPQRVVTVFYLTNKLTEEEQAAVEGQIRTSKPEIRNRLDEFSYPVHRFISWGADKAEDGATDRHQYSEPPYLFIDHQSVVDGTVIVAGPDLHWGDPDRLRILEDIPEPKLKGMLYCRVPAQRTYGISFGPHLSIIPVDPRFNIEAKRLLRPGWPGHEILREPDDYVPVVVIRSAD